MHWIQLWKIERSIDDSMVAHQLISEIFVVVRTRTALGFKRALCLFWFRSRSDFLLHNTTTSPSDTVIVEYLINYAMTSSDIFIQENYHLSEVVREIQFIEIRTSFKEPRMNKLVLVKGRTTAQEKRFWAARRFSRLIPGNPSRSRLTDRRCVTLHVIGLQLA